MTRSRRSSGAGFRRGDPIAVAAGAGVAVLVVLALYLRTMPPTITWWFGGSDSGELVSAADALGIAHPTGYPLFVLLGHLATRVPFGDVAARVNAMNAVLGALAAGGIVLTVLALTDRRDGRPVVRVVAAALAALAVATSSLYWSQAIIAEVYILQAALSVLVLFVWARRGTHPAARGVAHGLALTNHLTAVIFLGAALLTVARSDGLWRPRPAAWFALGMAAALCLYLLLPLRAAQGPVVNWGGDVTTLSGFLTHVTGQQYRGNLDLFDLLGSLRDLISFLRLMIEDLTPWLIPTAAVGVASLIRADRSYAWFTGLAVAGTLLFTASYRIADRAPYLLPVYVVVGVWGGLGLLAVLHAASGWARGRERRSLLLAGAGAGVLLLGIWVVRSYRQVDLSGDDSAVVFARTTLEVLPPNATYLSARDDVTFALWYAQQVLDLRRDVRVIDLRNPGLQSVP
jgi:hypothetical protein